MEPQNHVNHRTAWIVLAVVAILALGLVVWATSSLYYPIAGDSTAQTGTNTNGTGATGGTGGNTGGNVGGNTNTGGTGSTGTNRNLAIKIDSFIANDQESIPKMTFTLTGNAQGDMVSIVGKTGGEVVYVNELPVSASNGYSLDLGNLTRGDGTKTSVAPGEYFLRITDRNGTTLTQSGFFRIALGEGRVQ